MSWILVTGGAKRLGSLICQELTKSGHRVVIHYNKSKEQACQLQKICKGSDIIQGDFSENLDDFIRRYNKRFPNTKGVVNNVGNYSHSLPSQMNDLDSLLQTNLLAPIKITQALLPSIIDAKGTIVNLGVCGLSHAWTKSAAYGLTKSALLFYTRSLAKEVAKEGVCVNMISPGQLEISQDEHHAHPICSSVNVVSLVSKLFDSTSCDITGQNIELAAGYKL